MKSHHLSHRCFSTILLVAVASTCQIHAFSYPSHRYVHCRSRRRQSSSNVLSMALTPVGPFCPFRSDAAENMNPKMEEFQDQSPDFATELARFNLDMQMGQTPDPERLRVVAKGIDAAVDQWENLVTRLRISGDFQTKEYAKLTEAHLHTHGQSVEELGAMMKWQADCMRAMADNTPPPLPPPNVDLAKMMQEAENAEKESRPSPSMSAMAAAEQITSNPFDESTIDQSPQVKQEYETLVRDHQMLIDFGAKFSQFDPLGKLAFLDQIEAIEERWDVFFARFSLMGALNDTYIQQCNAFLQSMGMTEQDYRTLLRKSHDMMRQDAEAERNRVM